MAVLRRVLIVGLAMTLACGLSVHVLLVHVGRATAVLAPGAHPGAQGHAPEHSKPSHALEQCGLACNAQVAVPAITPPLTPPAAPLRTSYVFGERALTGIVPPLDPSPPRRTALG